MGEGEWFSAFCTELTIGTDKRGSIASRTGRIVGQLNHDLRDLDSKISNRFYAGSYGRNTAIPSVSDVDVIYELPAALYARFGGHNGNGQSALLALVRNCILNTYPSSAVTGDGQVVAIHFTDGIRFEVLPAFYNTAGAYTFADSNGGGRWRECKPRQELDAFSQRNAACNANLVRLCRMVRAWRDRNDVDMSGMLIDTLAYQFIATWEHRDKSYVYYDYLTRDFFQYLAGLDLNKAYWQAPGSGSYVNRGAAFQHKARSAELRAREAIAFQAANHNWSARQKYRDIYGTFFPE
ncbi:hypothetical protein [Dyella sp. ASV21]|uniref:SMODS domain-containing nucleotidyltransferase n=1 Tax=Dyella sp. ASV21 TaxID=2795114 RepID=UPI0018ED8B87|nr:hypothetical protein [Dyella sp. ASV21]